MNLKYLILALASVAFFSCDDTLDLIGSSIQPDTDILTVSTDTFNVAAVTDTVNSIYAKTTVGLLGNYYDDTYGNLKCDYMAQFYCQEGFYFHKELLYDKLDSATVLLTYQSYVGDSLAPMQVSVYQLNKQLENDIYSNTPYSKYCDKSILLAKKGYSAYDASLSDSLRKAYGSTKYVEIKLPKAIADSFYLNVKNHPEKFANNTAFQEYFPGVYITTSFGTGSIIKVLSTKLNFYFKYKAHYEDSDGNDSIVVTNGARSMAVTKEVFQVNRYENLGTEALLKDTTATYIKSPAGVFTKLTFPIGEMAKAMNKAGQGQRLNGVKLELGSFRVEKSKNILQPPTYLLMVKASEMKDLFSHKIAFDASKHLYATFSKTDNSYTFSNLRTFFEDDLSESAAPEDVYLVPITIANATSSGSVTKISHYFEPSAVKLKTKGLKMSIIYSK